MDNRKSNELTSADDSDGIPISDWNEEETDGTSIGLGPTNFLDSFLPWEAFLGEKPHIFLNKKYHLGIFSDALIIEVNPQTIFEIQQYIFSRDNRVMSTVNVSDGNTSHSIAPMGIIDGNPIRLLYTDPWHTNSFLEEGRNIANVRANSEGNGDFSITVDEYLRVLVAAGFVGLTQLRYLNYRCNYNEIKTSEFFHFFNIRETDINVISKDLQEIKLKTGGFQEFIDITVHVDKQGEVRHVRLLLNRVWIDQYGVNLFAVDLVKSLLDIFTPRQIHLSRIGVTADPVIPNPDRKLIDFLVSAIWELPNQEKTRQNFSTQNGITNAAFPVLVTLVGKSEHARINMPFSWLEVKNFQENNSSYFSLDLESSPVSAGMLS